ncbi:hypothetical protein GCM10027586_10040 [Kineococcus gypseus]|uniref:type II toxin-antitoxin system Phd/YefM family antitoxin n=1 Tax=Kineococcus gypseus TaxID=1637102 RepID=UPI003D7D686A
MKTISVRELRNDSGRVLREVEAGESFTITSNGRPVADISAHRPTRPRGVPLGQALGALSRTGPHDAEAFRRDVQERMDDDEPVDPYERWDRQRAEQEQQRSRTGRG